MGFRPPLDLSEILRHFEEFGGSSTAGMPTGSEWWQQPPGFHEQEARRRAYEEALANQPQLVADGPCVFTTCTTLALRPEVCWDCLGYYRTLGVHWKASKRDLMAAYQALGSMPSAWQTHCFKQLLQPQVRRDYDATPLGQVYFADPWVQAEFKRRAAEEARRRTQAGRPTSARDVIEEQFAFVPDEEDPGAQGVDSEASGTESAELSDPAPTVAPWPYGYFVWKTRQPDTTQVLSQWQTMLVAACAERGLVFNLAVGLVGKTAHRFVVGAVGPLMVVFLSDDLEPTDEIADAAVRTIAQITFA